MRALGLSLSLSREQGHRERRRFALGVAKINSTVIPSDGWRALGERGPLFPGARQHLVSRREAASEEHCGYETLSDGTMCCRRLGRRVPRSLSARPPLARNDRAFMSGDNGIRAA